MLLTDRVLRNGPALFEDKFAFADFLRTSLKRRSGGKWPARPSMPQSPLPRCRGSVRILAFASSSLRSHPEAFALGCKEIRRRVEKDSTRSSRISLRNQSALRVLEFPEVAEEGEKATQIGWTRKG